MQYRNLIPDVLHIWFQPDGLPDRSVPIYLGLRLDLALIIHWPVAPYTINTLNTISICQSNLVTRLWGFGFNIQHCAKVTAHFFLFSSKERFLVGVEAWIVLQDFWRSFEVFLWTVVSGWLWGKAGFKCRTPWITVNLFKVKNAQQQQQSQNLDSTVMFDPDSQVPVILLQKAVLHYSSLSINYLLTTLSTGFSTHETQLNYHQSWGYTDCSHSSIQRRQKLTHCLH